MKTYILNEIREKRKQVRLSDSKFVRNLKMLSYVIIFTFTGLVLNSCVGGYVASEPSYDAYDRPLPPSETHIWINGNWRWDHRTRGYVHEPGYWMQPRRGRIYEEGYWKSGPRGKWWINGHWRKEGHDNDRDHDRNHNHDRK